MGFLMGHSAWQIDQFPTCWPMNGLFVHWSRGWGVSSFSERLVYSASIFLLVILVFSTKKKPTNDDVFMHSGKQKCNNSPENLMICNSHDKISILRLAFSHGSVIRILNLAFIIFALRICHLAFYPRPVLAFGYCLACVCPSVSPSVCHQVCPRDNSSPVQARITKFGPLV